MQPSHLARALCPLLLPFAALAQNVSLDKTGGALGGTLSAHVKAQPNETYIVLFDILEQQTPIPALGITLDITDHFAGVSFALPGWFGNTDAQGNATASVTLPGDPALANLVLSLQAVAGNGPFRVSNLTRVTPQQPGTFAPTLDGQTLPIVGGGVVDQGDGDFLFVGGSGPIAQRYSERLEEWHLAGATFGVGLLGRTTPLPDGRVLFTGGIDPATGQPTDAAAVYDPATQQTTSLQMGAARAGHGASVLGNGKVLITGGMSNVDLTNPLAIFQGLLASTELFDPATDTFTPGPDMIQPLALHSSTSMPSGHVLILGGLAMVPLFNLPSVSTLAFTASPNGGSFGFPTPFFSPRFGHTATALDNGKVLLVGGISLDLTNFLQTGQLQDIVVGTRDDCLLYTLSPFGFGILSTVGGMQEGRAGAAIAPLPGGGALITGGFQMTIDIPNSQLVLAASATADVFSQGPNAIAPTGSMAHRRAFPIARPLPDGTVLVVGGGGPAEVYQR